MLPRPTTRVVAGCLTALTALAAAFTAGVVAGAGSTEPAPESPPRSGVLDDAATQIAGSALQPVEREALDAAAISGMLRAAGDEWGSWGSTGAAGVGVWLRSRNGRVVVARVDSGSAAATSGIRSGDEVRAVDGRSTLGVTAPVAAAALRGAPGTLVQVVVARGGVLRTLALSRAQTPDAAITVAEDPRGVTRIRIPSFTRGTGRQVREAVAGAHATGVVLDLRGNPGGLLDEAVETASAFLDGGPVVSYRRRSGEVVRLDAVGAGDTVVPLVVLVDGGTASAAEVVTGALQDRDRAVVVGSRTFGKGTVQEPRTLADGSALELTVATYLTPSGRSPEGTGLAPDLEVAPGSPPSVAEHRASDVLGGLVADSASGRG